MKKIVLYMIFLVIFCIQICSCSQIIDKTSMGSAKSDIWNSPIEYTNDRYIYVEENGFIVRYDTVAKKSSILCPDPLCKHDDKCVMNRKVIRLITDKNIYMVDSLLTNCLYKYDLSNNKMEMIFETDGQIFYPYSIGNYIYFSASKYEYDDYGNLSQENWHMYRINEKTNEIVQMSEDTIPDAMTCYKYNEYQDEIIWYYNTVSGTFYISTDFDFNEIEHIDRVVIPIDGYHYKIGFSNDSNLFSYERTNVETNEKEVIFDNAINFRVIKNHDGSFNGVLYINEKETLVYINLNDASNTISWNVPDYVKILDVAQYAGNSMCASSWVVANVSFYKTDADGHYILDDEGHRVLGKSGTMVVNHETGESFIFDIIE